MVNVKINNDSKLLSWERTLKTKLLKSSNDLNGAKIVLIIIVLIMYQALLTVYIC